ncbi:MAG: phage major capsid protein [Deltaproteobacteria bacterium]|nr:phage major capsid protein [Deltaproteobacteria bacterium]
MENGKSAQQVHEEASAAFEATGAESGTMSCGGNHYEIRTGSKTFEVREKKEDENMALERDPYVRRYRAGLKAGVTFLSRDELEKASWQELHDNRSAHRKVVNEIKKSVRGRDPRYDELESLEVHESYLCDLRDEFDIRSRLGYTEPTPEALKNRNAPVRTLSFHPFASSADRSAEEGKIILRAGPRKYGEMFETRSGGRFHDMMGFRDSEEFFEILASGRSDQRLIQARSARSWMGEDVGSLGGYAVPEPTLAYVMDKALEIAFFYPKANMIPMTSKTAKIPCFAGSDHTNGLYGGLQIQFAPEGGEMNLQTATVRLVELTAHKGYIVLQVSLEALEDGLSLGQQIQGAMINAIAFGIDQLCLTGHGAGQPLGVLNCPSLISVARATANQISYADILGLYSRCHPACLANAIWIGSHSVLPQLGQVSDSNGNNVWIQSAAAGVPGTLLQKPVILTEKTPALGTAGDLMLVDPSQYLFGLRNGAAIEMSNAPGFMKDLMTFKVTIRFDGQSLWDQPVTPANGGDTLSWAVALQ